MDLDLKSNTAHADRLAHIFLVIDDKFLRHGMQQLLVSWNIYCLGRFNNPRHVGSTDFFILDRHHAAGIETADMATSNTGVDIANLTVGHQFGLFQRALNRLDGRFNIDHHALFQPLRFRLPQANDFMASVWQHFGHHRNDLGGTNV